MTRSLVGEGCDLEVGPVAHGGHCVARIPVEVSELGGTVVFVRHALPGERVAVRITEGSVGDRFLRGDAVVVHQPSVDRVTAPCPVAGPGLCGGCDLQHVDLTAQRRWKAAVVAEQLRRLAGLDREVVVEPVPGDVDGLRWRTRMRFHRTADGRPGLRRHRSHEVVPVEDCLIQAPAAEVSVLAPESSRRRAPTVVEHVLDRPFSVAADGFWQPHRGAPETLVRAVLGMAEVRVADVVVDLYAGVGLFSAFLAPLVHEQGAVVAVEGDRRAAGLAERNLSAYPWARVVCGPVDRVLRRRGVDRADLVVLDPPRTGARRLVVEAVASLAPRAVVYVACDPAAFARDVRIFADQGYRLDSLRAFDLFPMTHHVEVVGSLIP